MYSQVLQAAHEGPVRGDRHDGASQVRAVPGRPLPRHGLRRPRPLRRRLDRGQERAAHSGTPTATFILQIGGNPRIDRDRDIQLLQKN